MKVRALRRRIASVAALIPAAWLLCCLDTPAARAERWGTSEAPVVRIIIEKSKRTLTLLKQDNEVKTYRIALGRDPVGPKVMRGDNKTPEGLYFVDEKIRDTVYHRALHLTYPSLADIEKAKSLGVEPGGDIEIHGMRDTQEWMGDRHYLFDWTYGCIALTNGEIDEIWNLVGLWTPVEIKP
jgi:murein L,D-transpeptidase YafK